MCNDIVVDPAQDSNWHITLTLSARRPFCFVHNCRRHCAFVLGAKKNNLKQERNKRKRIACSNDRQHHDEGNRISNHPKRTEWDAFIFFFLSPQYPCHPVYSAVSAVASIHWVLLTRSTSKPSLNRMIKKRELRKYKWNVNLILKFYSFGAREATSLLCRAQRVFYAQCDNEVEHKTSHFIHEWNGRIPRSVAHPRLSVAFAAIGHCRARTAVCRS